MEYYRKSKFTISNCTISLMSLTRLKEKFRAKFINHVLFTCNSDFSGTEESKSGGAGAVGVLQVHPGVLLMTFIVCVCDLNCGG